MNTTDTIAFFALLVAILALLFSFFVYLKDRKRNNQDQLFQEKLSSYKELLNLAKTTYSKLFDLVDIIQSFQGDENQWEKKYSKISGSYYGLAYEFSYALSKNSFIIPELILVELTELEAALIHFVTTGSHQNSEITIASYERLEERIERVENLIRKDLNIENLSRELNKRLR
ncbi:MULTISPECIES: hypothetical protein [Weeksellaceae]|uniref:hypothetical protein n=1 Tax=Weeksellaceae TaxID=2762318 RepID=UPI0010247AC8|nr:MULTISPECIES: hypothetical protein [Weeksellaceae]MYY44362.1 hypothetical protein [Elizabethkingia anophelis]UDQ54504.1 hypothetical protein LJF28_02250 [Chryseobacterium indologenes]VFA42964.1 Uncharacterised protein [Chryseobacterium indologenes]